MPTPDDPRRFALGPQPGELFRIFRLPAASVVFGIGFLLLGLLGPGSRLNGGTVLGGALLVGAIALGILEWRDLPRSWVAWDAEALTLGRARRPPLRVRWDDVRSVRLLELTPPGRFSGARQRLFLIVRLACPDLYEDGAVGDGYQDARVGDGAVGVPASEGSDWCVRLDQLLRDAGLPHYDGVVTRTDETPSGRPGLLGPRPSRP